MIKAQSSMLNEPIAPDAELLDSGDQESALW